MPRALSHRRMPIRVLPLTLLAVFLMLTVKVSDVWHGFSALQNIQVTTAQAQAQGASPQAATTAAAQPAKDAGAKEPGAKEAGPGAKPGEPQVATTAPLPTAK